MLRTFRQGFPKRETEIIIISVRTPGPRLRNPFGIPHKSSASGNLGSYSRVKGDKTEDFSRRQHSAGDLGGPSSALPKISAPL
jgi:hypothetical protein